MAVVAEQSEVADVGGPLAGCFRWEQVVRHASRGRCPALHAALVSADESVDLGWRRQPLSSSLPEKLAVGGEQLGNEGGIAGDLFDEALGEWLPVDTGERRLVEAGQLFDGGGDEDCALASRPLRASAATGCAVSCCILGEDLVRCVEVALIPGARVLVVGDVSASIAAVLAIGFGVNAALYLIDVFVGPVDSERRVSVFEAVSIHAAATVLAVVPLLHIVGIGS